ncbi:AraC family transcriptional regulator [Actinotalea sp. M2MS4P-6]|uniref:helix-turn-helix domain-containing protein n=1 Tax=Actinotalea sp. M2MS4P-6 TaxID=2983762 RepID=UPI0021E41003|nr:AraC family transcriptional regulator [Actinotalea sp. M2MS4P-6]MCV2394835.1 AraC family transcriptional regulator [Actinotalea sp. M2MS4P-6]
MSRSGEEINRAMLRVRDAIDAGYRDELDLATLAALVPVTPAHLVRAFRGVFGETPHRYVQRRRVERAMFLLRSTDWSVTRICTEVGFTSLGTFGRTFTAVVGESPSAYRRRGPLPAVPGCVTMAWMRPAVFREPVDDADFGEAPARPGPVVSRA